MRARLAVTSGLILLATLALPAVAQNVSYSGRMGDRALLVIDGSPRTLALGQEAQGVKLLMLDGERATVMIRNQRLSLQMGAQPASVGAAPAAAEASGSVRDSGQRIVLGAGADGHFQVNGSIGGYLRGQVIVSVIVAILVSLSLAVLNIPHPLFCGFFAGAASILPFIGVAIAVVPALFFAWYQYQSIAVLLKVSLAFAIIYFLEGYIVKPLVFKKSMNLNPLVTIIMVMALGELLGFWGILLALPIAAAIKITWGHTIKGDFRHRETHEH